VPFVAGGRGGGGGNRVDPGSYIVRVTAGGETVATSVSVVDDIWMKQY
jgi:hypothetical protein